MLKKHYLKWSSTIILADLAKDDGVQGEEFKAIYLGSANVTQYRGKKVVWQAAKTIAASNVPEQKIIIKVE